MEIPMSYHVSDESDIRHQSLERKRGWMIFGGLFLVLVIAMVILNSVGNRHASEIGGGVIIETDPDTRIYIGEKQVGTTQLTLSWEELLGNEKHTPMAIHLATSSS